MKIGLKPRSGLLRPRLRDRLMMENRVKVDWDQGVDLKLRMKTS